MVKSGDMYTCHVHQAACYVLIQRKKVRLGVKAPPDAGLIRHYAGEVTRSLQLAQCFGHTRQKLELRRGADVARVDVNDPISVEEGCIVHGSHLQGIETAGLS